MPKYTKLLTPAEYEKLTLDEKAEYITAMATVLKSRVPQRDPPPDATNQPQDDPPPPDATSQPRDDPPAPGATNQPQDDPPPRAAANQAQDDPSRSDDKPQEAPSRPN